VDKISPLPKAAAVVNTKKKQGVSQKATELTSSPYNLTLEEAEKNQDIKLALEVQTTNTSKD
jgi:hypothetical protein